jgi:hypothetical protein
MQQRRRWPDGAETQRRDAIAAIRAARDEQRQTRALLDELDQLLRRTLTRAAGARHDRRRAHAYRRRRRTAGRRGALAGIGPARRARRLTTNHRSSTWQYAANHARAHRARARYTGEQSLSYWQRAWKAYIDSTDAQDAPGDDRPRTAAAARNALPFGLTRPGRVLRAHKGW